MENNMHWSFVAIEDHHEHTREEAIEEAEKYGLQEEITYLMEHGYSPNAAMAEWDIL